MANKYYDPQKAHEYYEKHKKLKGRRSTKGFDDSQKAMWGYVKSELNTEKKQRNSAASAKAKEQRQNFTEQCKAKVAALREKLKGLSKEQKAAMKERVAAKIADIKAAFKEKKADVTANTKTEKANIKTDIDNKLDSAYESIKAKKAVKR